MKVIHISYSDNNGGAARAAYRTHRALLDFGIESSMFVQDSNLGDCNVLSFNNKCSKLLGYLRIYFASLIVRLLKTGNPILHSPSIFCSGLVEKINSIDADLIHLHWIQGEMLTISDLNKFNKPIVWTLHDMWAFCGAEHISLDYRWRDGYFNHNRPSHESGIDLNRLIWNQKKRFWKSPIQLIAPSNWLADCINQSAIMGEWPVAIVPNPLNIDEWKPLDKNLAREILNLPLGKPILLFGTMGANMDHNKGFDLLIEALNYMSESDSTPIGLTLVIFGQTPPKLNMILPFPVIYIGRLNDNLSLRALYSSSDAVVVPSRIESFGQTASEAHSCGTPVVSFDTSGLKDIIDHLETGYLAKSFDSIDLAKGICWVLNNPNWELLSKKARLKAVNFFSSELIAEKLIEVYNKTL